MRRPFWPEVCHYELRPTVHGQGYGVAARPLRERPPGGHRKLDAHFHRGDRVRLDWCTACLLGAEAVAHPVDVRTSPYCRPVDSWAGPRAASPLTEPERDDVLAAVEVVADLSERVLRSFPLEVPQLVERHNPALPSMTANSGARNPRATRSSRQPFHAANDSPPHSSRASRCWWISSLTETGSTSCASTGLLIPFAMARCSGGRVPGRLAGRALHQPEECAISFSTRTGTPPAGGPSFVSARV